MSLSHRGRQLALPLLTAGLAVVAVLYAPSRTPRVGWTQALASLAMPNDSWTNEACRFSYARFHLYFTLPPTAILYAVYRPFMTPVDHAKLLLLPGIAFVWTTLWDNELVRQRAWSYPRSCVMGVVGYVPVEEYFFVSSEADEEALFQLLTSPLDRSRSSSSNQS